MVKTAMLSRSYLPQYVEGTNKFVIQTLVCLMGFFLARAIFFEAAVPFLISLYAVVSLRYPHLKTASLVGGLIGALTLGVGQAVLAIGQLLTLNVLRRWSSMPLALRVFIAIGIVQFFWQLLMHQGVPPAVVQFYVASEAVLGMIMTMFLAVVFIPMQRFFVMHWPLERLAASFFVIAVVLTGMSNSTIYFFNIAIIVLHFTICFVALIGGIGMATVAATILGVVVGMSQLSFSGMMALCATTGLLVGSCRSLGKGMIAFVSFIPSIVFFFYDATLPLDIVYFSSISLATVLFLCTPKSWTRQVERFIAPDDEQTLLDRQRWLTDRMTQTLQQFQQFVLFMKNVTLERFQPVQFTDSKATLTSYPICDGCFRYEKCWQGIADIQEPAEQYYEGKYTNKVILSAKGEDLIRRKCVKADVLTEQIRSRVYADQMAQQMFHGRKMIALQLQHMSEHIYHLLEETREDQSFQQVEQQLLQQLQESGFPCFQVDIFTDAIEGQKIHLACTGRREQFTEWLEQIVLPMTFECMAEPFALESIEQQERPFRYMKIILKPALRFQLLHAVYAKKKGTVSGDTHSVFHLKESLVAVVLSDGMGYDVAAQKQSEQLVSLLQECLVFMDPQMAMQTIHYLMALDQQSDLYATLDFVLIDLQKGACWSWKAGGVATYIVRGKQVFKIEGNSPPFGFFPTMQLETATTTLQHGDLLFLVSDGLFDGAEGFKIREKAFLKLLKQQKHQKIAVDVLLYDVMTQFNDAFRVEDDCTVLACRMQHLQTEWSVLNVR